MRSRGKVLYADARPCWRVAATVLLVVGLAYLLWACIGPADPKLSESFWRLRFLGLAMLNYEVDHDCFPYHASGPDHALYLLAPYVAGVSMDGRNLGARIFDSFRPETQINGPAEWDHEEKKVIDADLDYLNVQGLRHNAGQFRRRIVIAAEKTGLRRWGKYCIVLPGVPAWYLYEPGSPQEILGRELTEDGRIRSP